MRMLTTCAVLLGTFFAGLAAIPTGRFDQPPPAKPVPTQIEIAAGPFKPSWDSLKQYRCPNWFRDAKLGIWAIVTPQSLAEDGDWYARHMYVEGMPQYQFHVEHFGHPSRFGYKDLAAAWKLEHFDPHHLMSLYKKAGAKYFVVLANHHDNWDNWNSKYHRWNSVNVGPHKDIVGLWASAAREYGLRFGVTEHLARSYSWFNTNKGHDNKGPLAGVPYDGNDPAFQDLYFPPHEDTSYAYPAHPPEWWPREWFWRIRDLIDTYRPDLMYSDGGVPFGEVGRSLMAHFYNANSASHAGKLEAVYTIKDMAPRTDHGDYIDGIGVQDVERGILGGIKSEAWQTDTCIGDWFYKTGISYKPVSLVIAMLADIVSKNGNLLLNIPLRHDGSIDSQEEKILADLGTWLTVNGEAIYGTRPWKTFGEGRPQNGGNYNEDKQQYSAEDIRFTTKGDVLYALVLDWPSDGKILVHSLAAANGLVSEVRLLGYGGELKWSQTKAGLAVRSPATEPAGHALTLKIRGSLF
ncbi:MAG: alpha-L-fucosidase [Candidatus Aminicenantales bacterium]